MISKIVLQDMKYIYNRISTEYIPGRTFLVVGANSFICRYFVQSLIYFNTQNPQNVCNIIALCRNIYKAKTYYKKYLNYPWFTLVKHDVLSNITNKISADYVIHAAGISTTKLHSLYPVETISANTVGTYNVLEYCKKSKGIKGFLFLSSGAVYGDAPSRVKEIREDNSFEVAFNDPSKCYIESKRMGELLCTSYAKEYQIPAKIIRITHTYGPGIDLNDGHIYSDFIRAIIKNQNLIINGSGYVYRPFCYITDCITAMFSILFLGETAGIYNMANNETYISIKDLANELVNHIFPERHLSINILNPEGKREIPVMLNTDRLCNLGWKPEITLKEGFSRTVESFLNL